MTSGMPGAEPGPRMAGADGHLRASDAERDAALSELGGHFGAGRLDMTEFDRRIAAAASAQTRADLDQLLADLPRPAPPPQAVTGHRPHRPRLRVLVLAALTLAALPAIAASGTFVAGRGHWAPWWLIPVAVFALFRVRRLWGYRGYRGNRGCGGYRGYGQRRWR